MVTTPLLLALAQVPGAIGADQDLQWTAAFEAPDAQIGDQFGRSVAAGGDRAVVSAWRRDGNTGGADVYRWEAGALVHEATLRPSDGFQGSMCGTSAHVNEEGDLVVLSALGDNTFGNGAGAVCVFGRDAAGWTERAKLFAPDAAESDGFGSSVAVGDGVVVVGARGVDEDPFYFAAGAVYVFEETASGWTLADRLTLPDIDIGDAFGTQISLDGGRFAVGVSAKDNEFGDNAGAVYVYEHTAAGWELDARVVTPDLGYGASFGRAVALDGDRMIVSSGVPTALSMAGTVHAFERTSLRRWVEVDRFQAPTPLAFDFFGESLALEDGRALVSARLGDGALTTAVYVYAFTRSGVEIRQALPQAVPPGAHVLNNSAMDLGSGFAIVGESLHGANVGTEASFVDVYRVAPARGRVGTVKSR
ncbi:MAG: hypothetical protein AAF957_24645 [Planctomycetota bacterium]